jgi:16S rRNA (cytidine1402-2'-O)-methyltransferase
LEDISLRALRVLGEADLILAEDTRHTRTLCAEHGIDTPMRSFHAHTKDDKVDLIVAELTKGAHYALVSDAGTPVVSDPGVYLVSRAAEAGVDIEAIPGPSAVLAALSVAGLPVRRFVFEGFLPRSGGDRARALDRVAQSDITVVLFESPHRIHATLDDLERKLGGDKRFVGRSQKCEASCPTRPEARSPSSSRVSPLKHRSRMSISKGSSPNGNARGSRPRR